MGLCAVVCWANIVVFVACRCFVGNRILKLEVNRLGGE